MDGKTLRASLVGGVVGAMLVMCLGWYKPAPNPRVEAKRERIERVTVVKGVVRGIPANANAANSIPALRAQVALLAEQVELLTDEFLR